VLRSWRPATGPTQPTPPAGGSPPCPDPRPAGGCPATLITSPHTSPVTESTPTPSWAADVISSLRYPLEAKPLAAGHLYVLPRPDGVVERIDLTNHIDRFYAGLEPIANQGEIPGIPRLEDRREAV